MRSLNMPGTPLPGVAEFQERLIGLAKTFNFARKECAQAIPS
jgi:hypothetical protein